MGRAEYINRCKSAVYCPIVMKFGRLVQCGFAEFVLSLRPRMTLGTGVQ